MRKEEMEQFKDKIPFKIISKKGSIATVRGIIRLNEETITFKDKFGGIQIIELEEIAQISEINQGDANGR